MSHDVVAAKPAFFELAAEIASANISRNSVPVSELPALIAIVHAALGGLGQPTAPQVEDRRATPAQIRKSITPDALISFLNGKSYKSLKRHLTAHGMTPDAYRQMFGLASDYPIVAASYAAARSALAKNIVLGQLLRSREKAGSKVKRCPTTNGPTRNGPDTISE